MNFYICASSKRSSLGFTLGFLHFLRSSWHFLRKSSPVLLHSSKVILMIQKCFVSESEMSIHKESSSFIENCIWILVLYSHKGSWLRQLSLELEYQCNQIMVHSVRCKLHFTIRGVRGGMEDGGKGNYFSSPLSQIHLQLNINLGACYAKTGLETAQTPVLLNQMAISTLSLEMILMIYPWP